MLQTLGEQCQIEELVAVGLQDGKMGVGLVLDFFPGVRGSTLRRKIRGI